MEANRRNNNNTIELSRKLWDKRMWFKQKEYPGHTAHCFGIRARTSAENQELNTLLQKWRKEEEVRKSYLKYVDFHQKAGVRYDWDRKTAISTREARLKRQAHKVTMEEKLKIADRQMKLSEMLSKENEKFFDELPKETTEDRYQQTKKLVQHLREVNEQKRLEFVDNKLKQQFREGSQDFRNILHRHHTDEVCRDRSEQLLVKAEKRRLDRETDSLYANLWENDRLQKAAREEREMREKHEANRQMVSILNTQVASKEAKKEEEKKLLEEEAKLFREGMEMIKEEDQMLKYFKQESIKERKELLDEELKLKKERVKKDEELEQALDSKILQRSLEKEMQDTEEKRKQKQFRKDMDFKYRQYLKEQREKDKIYDQDFQKLVDEDVGIIWRKRMQKVRMEKEARNKLLLDVLNTRREQVQLKRENIDKEKEDIKRDREVAKQAAEEQKRIDEERKSITKMINKNHQSDLLDQIKHLERLKLAERENDKKEFEDCLDAEVEFQEKLQQMLTTAHAYDKQHPLRKKLPLVEMGEGK